MIHGAEPHYESAPKLSYSPEVSDHPDVALSLRALASLYELQGRFTEAVPLYKRVYY